MEGLQNNGGDKMSLIDALIYGGGNMVRNKIDKKDETIADAILSGKMNKRALRRQAKLLEMKLVVQALKAESYKPAEVVKPFAELLGETNETLEDIYDAREAGLGSLSARIKYNLFTSLDLKSDYGPSGEERDDLYKAGLTGLKFFIKNFGYKSTLEDKVISVKELSDEDILKLAGLKVKEKKHDLNVGNIQSENSNFPNEIADNYVNELIEDSANVISDVKSGIAKLLGYTENLITKARNKLNSPNYQLFAGSRRAILASAGLGAIVIALTASSVYNNRNNNLYSRYNYKNNQVGRNDTIKNAMVKANYEPKTAAEYPTAVKPRKVVLGEIKINYVEPTKLDREFTKALAQAEKNRQMMQKRAEIYFKLGGGNISVGQQVYNLKERMGYNR